MTPGSTSTTGTYPSTSKRWWTSLDLGTLVGDGAPLEIVARLVDGRVATYDGYLPIDSVLAWAWVAEHRPDLLEVTQPGQLEEDLEIPLPLTRRVYADGDWCWAASFAVAPRAQERRQIWHRRFDAAAAEEYTDRRGQVNTSGGRLRDYRVPLPILLVPELRWYCVGDGEEILCLLRPVAAVGKKRAQGLGRVREWVVQPAPEDRSWWRPHPDPDGTDEVAIRPPYWDRRNVRRVVWPDVPLAARALPVARPDA